MNLRPSGYEPDELPDCSTPRYSISRWNFMIAHVAGEVKNKNASSNKTCCAKYYMLNINYLSAASDCDIKGTANHERQQVRHARPYAGLSRRRTAERGVSGADRGRQTGGTAAAERRKNCDFQPYLLFCRRYTTTS